jgi:hypothetical protein
MCNLPLILRGKGGWIGCTTSVPMRACQLETALESFRVATHHPASRQSNGRCHDVMCIFQQYGQAFGGQQRRRRQDVLRRLERELDRKHTVVVSFAPIPRSGCMKAIRSGGIRRYIPTALSSARRWVNKRKDGQVWGYQETPDSA